MGRLGGGASSRESKGGARFLGEVWRRGKRRVKEPDASSHLNGQSHRIYSHVCTNTDRSRSRVLSLSHVHCHGYRSNITLVHLLSIQHEGKQQQQR